MANPFEAALPASLAGGKEKEKKEEQGNPSAKELEEYGVFLKKSRALLVQQLDDLAAKHVLETTPERDFFTLPLTEHYRYAKLLEKCLSAGFSVRRGERFIVISRPEEDLERMDEAA